MRIIAILPDIRSVHNVGSIFRTADAAGAEKIYCCGYTPTPLDRFGRVRQDFAKVSLGAEVSVAWEYGKSVARIVTRLRKDGWKIFAVEQAKNSIPYHKIPKKYLQGGKVALIMGNEVDGISAAILKKCDAVLEIPMRGAMVRQAHHPRRTGAGKESLNVGVAFGIVAFRLVL
jgi:tRNA G18 (ribose-2'-O)-methylase SpoU